MSRPAWVTRAALCLAALLLGACSQASPSPSAVPSPTPSAAAASPSPALGLFGQLPRPKLSLPPAGQGALPPWAVQPYYGPARLSWAGTLPAVPPNAPVLRYREATRADADALAAALHAQNVGAAEPPLIASYQGSDFTLIVLGSRADQELEPRYVLTPPGSEFSQGAPSDAVARSTAEAFLARYHLQPPWPDQVVIDHVHGPAIVVYNRLFALPGGLTAAQVNAQGDPTGLLVTLSGPKVFQAEGELPLAAAEGQYPVLDPAHAVQAALASPPATLEVTVAPEPEVRLTQVRLVYLAVSAGGEGFHEPAYLFTGTFRAGGQQYEKRVLVPAVDPSYLR